MTFTLRQNSLTAAGTTSAGTTYLAPTLPALSLAGSLLTATMQTAAGGTPFKILSLATPPGGVGAAAVGSGGTFAAGTFFWKVTAITASGETTGSAEVSATLVLNGSANLTWSGLPSFVTGVKVYRGTSATNEDHLIATLGRVTSYTDTGAAGSVASPPNTNTAGIPNTSPGWEYCGLAAAGTTMQAEIWCYRNAPAGMSGATFTNAAGAACRGTIEEWTTTQHWQVMELFPGASGATGTGNAAAAMGNSVGSGELAIALLAEHFTASPAGQTWTTPAGWTPILSQANGLATPWAAYYKITTGAGAVSITGNYSTTTNQDAKAGVVVVFREAASVAARVGVGGINAGTYDDQGSFGYPATHVGSCQEFDHFVGRTQAMSSMVGFQSNEGSTISSVPGDISDMWAAGAQIHYAMKPQRALSGGAVTTEQGKVDTALTTFKQAGITGFSVSFFNEFNNGGQNGFFGNDTSKPSGDPYGKGNTEPMAKANWLSYWAMWQPVAAAHGIPAFTKPGSASPKAAIQWQPPAGTLSGVIQDFYFADSDGKSFYLDQPFSGAPSLQDVCDGVKNPDGTNASNPPIPLGIGEWGRAGGSSSTVPWSTVAAWSHTAGGTGHVRDFFKKRLTDGKQNAVINWFENNGPPAPGPNWIHVPGDGTGGDITPMITELRACSDNLTVSVVTGGNPVITTTSPLPAGTVGTPYSASLAATGGTTPYTWSVTTGSLPAGLVLNAATGQITGSPATAGTVSAGFTVTDNAGLTGTATLSITIAGGVLAIPPQVLPPGTTGVPYVAQIVVTGGTPPAALAVTAGSLPAGLTLSAGVIAGTPSSGGTATFTVTATDALSATASRSLSITVSAPALGILNTVLPPGVVGEPYSAALAASGGTPPYTFARTAGVLPGVTVDPSGSLSGTPVVSGSFPFTAQVTDNLGATATASLTLIVTPAALAAGVGPVTPKRWVFLLAEPQPDGTALAAVTQAGARRFTIRQAAEGHHEISFDINGLDPAVSAALPLATDVQVILDGQVLLIGRLGAEEDDLDGTRHTYTPTALDYREVLRRRDFAYGGGPNFDTDTDTADIAWALLRNNGDVDGHGHPGIQNYPGGNLGIARGAGAGGSGVTTQINYIRQQFAGAVIDALAQLGTGFDWDVSAYGPGDLRLDTWPGYWPSGGRGQDRGVVLAYGGGMVASMHRSLSPESYANSVFVTGADLSASTTVEAGSNGGVISNIAGWSVPIGAGNLDVADSSQFTGSGLIQVHCSNHTNAIVAYTGTSSGGRFTGCTYVSGASGQTVSTGASVNQVPLQPAKADAADIASRAEGRWDAVIGTQHTLQPNLDRHAAWALQAQQVILPTWTIILEGGAWQGPDHIWLGDTVVAWAKSGRLQVNDALPVTEMAFAIDANNKETVQITAGRPLPKWHRRIKRIERRLLRVETQ